MGGIRTKRVWAGNLSHCGQFIIAGPSPKMLAGAAQLVVSGFSEGLKRTPKASRCIPKTVYLAGVAFLFVLPLLYFLKVPDDAKDGPPGEKIEVHME